MSIFERLKFFAEKEVPRVRRGRGGGGGGGGGGVGGGGNYSNAQMPNFL